MTSMDRRDAIQLAMSTHLIYQAHRDPSAVPTEEELTNLHAEAGEAWEDLVDDLVCAAHPFVSEDGTWLRHHAGQTVVEEVGIDDVLAAEAWARARADENGLGIREVFFERRDGIRHDKSLS